MNANPVLIVPLAMLAGERPTLLRCVGVLLGLAGCVLVTHGTATSAPASGQSHAIGGTLALLSGLSWAAYTVFGKEPVRQHGSLACTTLAVIVGSVLLGLTALAARSDLRVSATSAALIVYLAIAPTFLGFLAWYKALETLPASVLGPFQFLQPALGVLLAALILGEKLTLLILAGALLAFVGVYCTTRGASSS
jgi:DME family drug/metabolite transporter